MAVCDTIGSWKHRRHVLNVKAACKNWFHRSTKSRVCLGSDSLVLQTRREGLVLNWIAAVTWEDVL